MTGILLQSVSKK